MSNNASWLAAEYRERSAASATRPAPSGVSSAITRLFGAAVSAVIVAVFVPLGAAASGKMKKFLLAMALLNIPLQVAKHFFSREEAYLMGSLGGLEVSIMNLALAGLYVSWFLERRNDLAPERRTPLQVSLPLVLFLIFHFLSFLAAIDTTLAMFETFMTLELALLYFYIVNKVNTPEEVAFIVRILLIGLVIEAPIMLGQAAGVIGDINVAGIKARSVYFDSTRVSGTLGAPNSAASYLNMLVALGLSVMMAPVKRLEKWIAGAGAAMGTIALIFTGSRGGWFGFVLSIGILIVFGRKRRRIPLKTIVAVAAVVIVVALPFAMTIGERLTADDNGAAQARMPLNKIAGLMILEHPLFGVGANNFATTMPNYLSRGFLGEWLYTVHNKYLLICAETGICGLAVYLWFIFGSVRKGLHGSKGSDPLASSLALGCLAATVGHMVHMLVEVFRGGPDNHLLWLLSGLMVVCSRLAYQERTAKINPRPLLARPVI